MTVATLNAAHDIVRYRFDRSGAVTLFSADDADGWKRDGADNKSWTHVHIGADGRVTVTTRTVDSRGNGTEHTTTTDSGGNIISDKTKRVVGGEPQAN